MAAPERMSDSNPEMSGAGCLIRLAWVFAGNAVLFICLVLIARHRGSSLSPADAVYGAMVPVLVWLRWLDLRHAKASTPAGQPASLAPWKRYVGLLLLASAVAWSAAHAFAWMRG